MSGQSLVRLAIFPARSVDHIRRQCRSGRLFRPADALKIIADKLFVERWLGLAGLIGTRGPETRGIGRERFVDPHKFLAVETELEFCVGNNNSARGGVFR